MSRHLSHEEISQWMAGERTLEQETHLRECPTCAAEVDALARTFALFRESGQRWSDHLYTARPVPAMPARRLGWLGLVAMVAIVAACMGVCLMLLSPSARPRKTAEAELPFVEMPYVAPLAPYERTEIVRMDVTVASLEAAGLEVNVPDTGATVLADVLLGQDGRAHAIRLVSEVSNRRVNQ